jgi:hypothetical protein
VIRFRKETEHECLNWLTDEQMARMAPYFPKSHVWTTPAAQELLFSDEHRSGASMCSACSHSTVWLLALMKSAGWLPNHVIAL